VHLRIDPLQRMQRFERWDARCSLRWPLAVEPMKFDSLSGGTRLQDRRLPHIGAARTAAPQARAACGGEPRLMGWPPYMGYGGRGEEKRSEHDDGT